jgi:poly(A) polymerase
MRPSPLIDRLTAAFADRQVFLVGGSVRDELLGRPDRDLDFATDARPEEVRARVEPWADSVWLVGEEFGTVGLMLDGEKAEITTFRRDSYDFVSRKPAVTFGDDLLDDLSRRDFTINAIAHSLHSGELLDPFGGREDLADCLVRFVGDPGLRIVEDPLRMLRGVRFCAQLFFELDPVSAAGIAEHAPEISRISWERLRGELDGLLTSDHPKEGLRLLLDLGLAHFLLPELERLHLPEPARYQMKDVLEHTLDTVAFVPPDKALRYAALFHDIAKPDAYSADETGVHFYRHEDLGAEVVREILARLRQPADFIDAVAVLVRDHLRLPFYRSDWSASALRRLMYELGDHLEANLLLADADVRASDPHDYEEFSARMAELRRRLQEEGEAAELARMRPLLDGHEIMALLGLPPGPRVGEIQRYLLDQQIEGTLHTKEEAIEAVRREFA